MRMHSIKKDCLEKCKSKTQQAARWRREHVFRPLYIIKVVAPGLWGLRHENSAYRLKLFSPAKFKVPGKVCTAMNSKDFRRLVATEGEQPSRRGEKYTMLPRRSQVNFWASTGSPCHCWSFVLIIILKRDRRTLIEGFCD
jgi:hypothetical protein